MTSPNAPAKVVETKTKAATTAAGVGSLVLLIALGAFGEGELLKHVPDGFTVLAGSILTAAVTFLRGFATRHVPGKLSQSALETLEGLRR